MRIAVALLASLLLGACAEDQPAITAESPPAATEEPASGDIAVTAVEYEFQGVPETVAEGEVNFTLTNKGGEPHVLYLFYITGEQAVEELLELPEKQRSEVTQAVDTAETRPGKSAEFTAALVPGRFGYVCFVESPDGTSHALLGMRGELTVA